MITCVQILARLGKHPHPRGMQVLDKRSFKEMRAKLRWIFATKVPIYENNHPDEIPMPKDELKSLEVGFVKDLILTDNVILMVSKYKKKAYREIKNGRKLSPRWKMESLNNGEYRPIRLISVGITDIPNIKECGTPFRVWESEGVERGQIMNIETKLKPCPFCGGMNLYYAEGSTQYYVPIAFTHEEIERIRLLLRGIDKQVGRYSLSHIVVTKLINKCDAILKGAAE